VEGSCEHGNEPAGSIKFCGNSGVAAQLATSEEGLISMELVNLYFIKIYISSHFRIITYLKIASIAHLDEGRSIQAYLKHKRLKH
jgi:hypothetical protein